MELFLPILESMSLEAMSGDESTHEMDPPLYAITVLPWRNASEDVVSWFRTFDRLHLSTRFGTDDRPRPGNFPHRRLPSSNRLEAHAPPVPGLPENFYDPVWLQTLDGFETKQLNIRPPIDLTFPPGIMQ